MMWDVDIWGAKSWSEIQTLNIHIYEDIYVKYILKYLFIVQEVS